MRTPPEENRAIGEWIGAKLNKFSGPVRFLISEKGVSLIEALEITMIVTETRQLLRCPLHINDPEFATALVAAWRDITGA